MKIKSKTMLGVSLFAMTFSFGATAQTCKPVPSCESLGYTKTSCSGDTIKCPFDTNKMYCIEKCPLLCEVGYIYYSDDTCSSKVISGKTPIGVVFDSNRQLVVSLDSVLKPWNDGSANWKEVSGLKNYDDSSTAQQDFNGKSNTDTIVAFAKSSGQTQQAAQYCHDKTTAGKIWYLPALGEIRLMATNYSTVNTSLSKVGEEFDHLWSSTEASDSAWYMYPRNGYANNYLRNHYSPVRCIFSYE